MTFTFESLQHHPFVLWSVVFLILCARYLLVSGGGYLLVWKIFSSSLEHRRIQGKDRPLYIRQEITWSLLSFAMMAMFAAGLAQLNAIGIIKVSWNDQVFGFGYHVLSLIVLFLVHDAYFYWMHRLLHHPRIFKYVHKIHHRSITPTPWAAFSFHPVEAVLEMFFLLPVLCLLPVHIYVLSIFLLFSHIFNMLGHLGFELLPPQTWSAWWGSWLTTTTHHNLHHQYFQGNYALYFKHWDKIGKTLLPQTQEEFERITRKNKNIRQGSL